MLAMALRFRQARPFVICDRTNTYIAPMEWCKSDEQLRMIVDYPKALLEVSELSEPEYGALAAVNDEAVRLRSLLRARNGDIDTLQRKISALEGLNQAVEEHVQAVEKQVQAVEKQVRAVEEQVQAVEAQVQVVKEHVLAIKGATTWWRLAAPIRALRQLTGKHSPDERSE
jgi:septal ring factor EnvC (AmiA/AmiB activator)